MAKSLKNNGLQKCFGAVENSGAVGGFLASRQTYIIQALRNYFIISLDKYGFLTYSSEHRKVRPGENRGVFVLGQPRNRSKFTICHSP